MNIDMNVAISDNECAQYGIRWETEAVAKVFGENNQSDKRPVNTSAQIAVIADIDAFRAAFGDAYILASSNGTSLRVMCQRIGRKFSGNDILANRRAVIHAIQGVRVSGARTTVRHDLPNGTTYAGTNETEYRQMYAAMLVDMGADGTLALTLAKNHPW